MHCLLTLKSKHNVVHQTGSTRIDQCKNSPKTILHTAEWAFLM